MSCTLLLTLLFALQAEPPSPRMRQYLGLAAATLRNPIQPTELEAALLSPEGVAAIRGLFERSIEESLVANSALVTPELGGEATLEGGRMIFVPYPDPAHAIVRETVSLESEPVRLLEHLESSAEGKRILTETGGLHALLYMMTNGEPTEQQAQLLRDVVASAVAIRFKTWSTDPFIQARMIDTTDWRGRYVGFWHIHPPRLRGGDLAEGLEPSVPDMTHAAELGQFLTIVFQPEGFDAYDLSRLGATRSVDLTRARVYRHRDPAWKASFETRMRARLGERD